MVFSLARIQGFRRSRLEKEGEWEAA